jgi:hypothetical protein
VHICGAQIGQEGRAQHVGAPEEEEDGGSPSGGGDKLTIVDGLAWLQVETLWVTSREIFRRRWTYPPFVPPPLHIFNQEENTTDSEDIGVEEREEEDRSKEMSEEEGEVNNTLPQGIVVWKNQTPSSQRRGTSSSLKMENQDST